LGFVLVDRRAARRQTSAARAVLQAPTGDRCGVLSLISCAVPGISGTALSHPGAIRLITQ